VKILPAKDALNASNAHAINDVTSQSERNSFRCGKDSTLLKRDSEVNMNQLSTATVYENVLHMPVTQTKNVANC